MPKIIINLLNKTLNIKTTRYSKIKYAYMYSKAKSDQQFISYD